MSRLNFLLRYATDGRHYDTETEISKALDSSNSSVRLNALNHPNVTPENINKALNDQHHFVVWKAIQHKNATSENYTAHKNRISNDDRYAAYLGWK